MKTMRVVSVIMMFALLFMLTSCEPFDDYFYNVNNQSSEDLYVTLYSSDNTNIFLYFYPDKPFCQATIGRKSNNTIFAGENFVRDVSVFLSMADSCVVQLADSNGAVVKRWYRNYDKHSSKKEFFDTKYWTTSGKNGDCFTFSISDADLEMTGK